MLVELFENGYIAQILLIALVWVPIAFLTVTGKPVPDPLFDAGFMMVGFYFRAALQNGSTKVLSIEHEPGDTLDVEGDERA